MDKNIGTKRLVSNYETLEDMCHLKSCLNCELFDYEEDCSSIFEKIKYSHNHEVYIAAPFFNQDQITRVALVETLLEKLGITYFSPRKDSACENISDPKARKRVFDLNCESIKNSKMVIAITDDKDVGTMIEVGMAHALNIPIIGAAFTLKPDQLFNLMIAEACTSVAKTKEELELSIKGEKIEYKGDIE